MFFYFVLCFLGLFSQTHKCLNCLLSFFDYFKMQSIGNSYKVYILLIMLAFQNRIIFVS